jgi:predicted permease
MSWWSRLTNAINPRTLDASLEDEIQDHLERHAAALRAQGVSPGEARRRAAIAFGSATRIREQSREIRLWATLESALQDVRYACRTMRKSPTFTLTAIVSLSLAIGATSAISAILDAAMLRPLAVPDARRVFALVAPVLADSGATAHAPETETFSYPLFLQLRAAAGDAARLAAVGPLDRADVHGVEPTSAISRVRQQFIAGEAFETLRVAPALGRLFSRDDDRAPRGQQIAVLSFDYWHSHFNEDPGVLGRSVVINGRPHEIVGVVSKDFVGVEPGRFVDVWVPLMTFDPGVFSNAEANLFRIVVRLGDQTTADQLQARLQAVFRDRQRVVVAKHPEMTEAAKTAFAERQIQVRPGGIGTSPFQRTFSRPIWIVWGVAAAILLVACANVASLLTSRSASRTSEMMLRTSVGASRSRLIRQLLTENLMLIAVASVLGLILATIGAPWLVTWLSTNENPVRLVLAMDARVLLFSAGVCAAVTLVVGVLPAWQSAAGRVHVTMTPERGTVRRSTLGGIFISVQVAFVFCLVVVGTGFLFSLHKLLVVDTGFDPRDVTVLTMRSELGVKMDGLAMTQQLQRHLSTVLHVDGVASGWGAIFGDGRRAERIILEGKTTSEREETFYRVSPQFFSTLKTPLLAGRDFDFRDTDGAQPIPTIVNRAFARRYFGGDNVIGREFRRRSDDAQHVIIGLAADAYYSDLRSGLQPVVYFPMKPPRFFTLYVRSPLDPGSVRQLVEREATSNTPGLHVVDVTTLETLIGNTLVNERLLASVGGVFALLGLVLVAIGLFGVLNHSVLRRTQELGLRTALGASQRALILLVLRDVSPIMAGGLTAGVCGSLILMRLVQAQFFGVSTADPIVVVTASGVFLLVTALAVARPVYRAATMDPLVALRQG